MPEALVNFEGVVLVLLVELEQELLEDQITDIYSLHYYNSRGNAGE